MANNKSIKYRLIDETIQQVNAVGYDKLSLRKVAAICGVTHSTIYKYFSNKQKLLESVFPYIWTQLYPFIDKTLVHNSPAEQFLSLSSGYAQYMLDHPQQYQYLVSFRVFMPVRPSSSVKLVKSYFQHYASIIFSYFKLCGISDQETDIMFGIYTAILNGFITLCLRGQILYNDDISAILHRLLIQELKLYPKTDL